MSTVPPHDRPEGPYGGPPPPAGGWADPAAPPAGQAYPPAGPPPPGAWAQPQPGYAQPGYGDPAQQQTTAWAGGPGPGGGYRPRRPRRTGPSFISVAPALFVSVVISIGVLVLFVAGLFIALGQPNGTPGRQRLLQFLSAADLTSAIAVALALGLVVLQRQLAGPPVAGPPGGRVRSIALLAGVAAAVVAVGALVRGIVYLTIPHQPGAVSFGFFVASLVTVAIAGAAAAWGLRNRW